MFSIIVLLRIAGAALEVPLLQIELDKDAWQTEPDKTRFTVSVPPEAMQYASSMQVTNRTMLSGAQAGIRKGTLIINLPGSPKAARENLEAVLPTLGHGLEILSGHPADCAGLTDFS